MKPFSRPNELGRRGAQPLRCSARRAVTSSTIRCSPVRIISGRMAFIFCVRGPHYRPGQCLFDNWWYASPASVVPSAMNTSATESLTGDGAGEVPVKWLTCGEDSIGPAIEDDVAVFITQQRGVRSRGFKAPISRDKRSVSRAITSASMTTSIVR